MKKNTESQLLREKARDSLTFDFDFHPGSKWPRTVDFSPLSCAVMLSPGVFWHLAKNDLIMLAVRRISSLQRFEFKAFVCFVRFLNNKTSICPATGKSCHLVIFNRLQFRHRYWLLNYRRQGHLFTYTPIDIWLQNKCTPDLRSSFLYLISFSLF